MVILMRFGLTRVKKGGSYGKEIESLQMAWLRVFTLLYTAIEGQVARWGLLPEVSRKARKGAEEGGFNRKSGVLNHIEVG
jgi:hypothetical protein